MKHLHLLLVGAFVNSVGTGMTAFGLAIFAYTTYGTASSVALVQLCAFAPIILLAPVAGALADRFDRRLMMVIGDGGSVLGLGVVMAALSASEPRLSHILTGVVVSSCLAALTEPALRASVTDLVDEDDYVRSAGLLQAASSARYLLSPLLAGLLLPLVGLRGLLALDASTCLVTVACSIAVMRAVGRRSTADHDTTAADHLLGGWRAVTARPNVRSLVAVMTFMTLTIGIVQVLLKPILLPHMGTTTMGQVETAAATGILAGAGLVTALARLRPTTLLSLGTAGAGITMMLLALRTWPWWAGLTGFAVFACLALCNAGAETLVRLSIDKDRQARVWGTISLVTQLGYLLAYLSAGPLADHVLQPFMDSHSPLAHSLGAVMGTGTGRGAALLVALAGLITIGLAALIHTRRRTLTPPPSASDSPDSSNSSADESRHSHEPHSQTRTDPQAMISQIPQTSQTSRAMTLRRTTMEVAPC